MKSIPGTRPGIHPAVTENSYRECACGTHSPKIDYWKTQKTSTLRTQLCFKHLCNPSSHYGKYREYTREMRTPYLDTWNASILAMSNSFHNIASKQGIPQEVSQQSLCLALKPLRAYHQSSPYAVVKKIMGDHYYYYYCVKPHAQSIHTDNFTSVL